MGSDFGKGYALWFDDALIAVDKTDIWWSKNW